MHYFAQHLIFQYAGIHMLNSNCVFNKRIKNVIFQSLCKHVFPTYKRKIRIQLNDQDICNYNAIVYSLPETDRLEITWLSSRRRRCILNGAAIIDFVPCTQSHVFLPTSVSIIYNPQKQYISLSFHFRAVIYKKNLEAQTLRTSRPGLRPNTSAAPGSSET